MKRRIAFYLSLFVLLTSCGHVKHDDSEQWIQLFNGKDLTGWDIKIAGHPLNENFNNNFYVKDSVLKIDYSGFQKFNREFGHLYYKEPFSYYRVRVEYRFTGQQLEGGIIAETIGIIGILVAGHDLVHPLPQQRQTGVPNTATLSGIAELLR